MTNFWEGITKKETDALIRLHKSVRQNEPPCNDLHIEALQYYHRLRDAGFSYSTARNSTLFVFSSGFADLAKRMRRYLKHILIYPETMEFGTDEIMGSEADVLRALNERANPKFRLSKKEAINDV